MCSRSTTAALEAVERARAGSAPQFIEALTYRFVGHSRSDPGRYRKPGELDAWRERDPLSVIRTALTDRLGAATDDLDAVDSEIEAELDAIVQRSLSAPFPTPGPARQFKD